MTVTSTHRIPIAAPADVEHARRQARAVAHARAFARVDVERLVLAVSELAMNLLRYAHDGTLIVTALDDPPRAIIRVESCDRGPGIADLDRALEDGFSTGGGLGSGLPAVRRLLDDFTIESGPSGTRITAQLCTTIQ